MSSCRPSSKTPNVNSYITILPHAVIISTFFANEYYLSHLLSVGFGVQWSLGQQNWVFLWGNPKFVVEGVMPDLKFNKNHE